MANVNNSTNAASYITYRRATELNPCNEFVVMDLAVVISSKGEVPPHTFEDLAMFQVQFGFDAEGKVSGFQQTGLQGPAWFGRE